MNKRHPDRKSDARLVQAPAGADPTKCARCGVELLSGYRCRGFCAQCYGILASGEVKLGGKVPSRKVTGKCSVCERPLYDDHVLDLCGRCADRRRKIKHWEKKTGRSYDGMVSYRNAHRGLRLWSSRAHTFKLKIEAIHAYGGKCACCGEDRIWFLSLHHVNGDGKDDRLEHGKGITFYRYLKNAGFPDKDRYSVLCFNCHYSGQHFKSCPHKGVDKEWQSLYTQLINEMMLT